MTQPNRSAKSVSPAKAIKFFRFVRSRTTAATAMCFAAAGGAFVAGTAMAQPDLYIAEYQFQAARISAVRTDGVNPRVLFALPAAQWLPSGLTFNVATGRLIWSDGVANQGRVINATPSGTGYGVLAVVGGNIRGASLDAQGRIYYASSASLNRVNADGTGVTTIYTNPGGAVIGQPRVDAVNGHVYVGAGGRIIRINISDLSVRVVVNGVSQPRAIALDIGNNFIYWIDADTITDFVGRARLDGSGFTVLIDNTPGVGSSSGLLDLAVLPAADQLFYADEFRDNVTRTSLAGLNPEVVFTSQTGKSPSGLAFSTGEPAQPLFDLNGNGVADDIDIANGAPDCDSNGVPDSAQTDPCLNRVLLLDQGTLPLQTTGRAVGSTSQWQIFQPFDVPASGWTIGEIGLDGFTSQYGDGSGLRVRVFADNGSGTNADETVTLAQASMNLRFNTSLENWVYAPLNVSLPAGRHWLRIEGNQLNIYNASINFGTTGLMSKSRGVSGTFTAAVGPIAVRLVETRCIADVDDGTGTGTRDGGVGIEDLLYYLGLYDAGLIAADVDDGSGTGTRDGGIGIEDLLYYLLRYDAGC